MNKKAQSFKETINIFENYKNYKPNFLKIKAPKKMKIPDNSHPTPCKMSVSDKDFLEYDLNEHTTVFNSGHDTTPGVGVETNHQGIEEELMRRSSFGWIITNKKDMYPILADEITWCDQVIYYRGKDYSFLPKPSKFNVLTVLPIHCHSQECTLKLCEEFKIRLNFALALAFLKKQKILIIPALGTGNFLNDVNSVCNVMLSTISLWVYHFDEIIFCSKDKSVVDHIDTKIRKFVESFPRCKWPALGKCSYMVGLKKQACKFDKIRPMKMKCEMLSFGSLQLLPVFMLKGVDLYHIQFGDESNTEIHNFQQNQGGWFSTDFAHVQHIVGNVVLLFKSIENLNLLWVIEGMREGFGRELAQYLQKPIIIDDKKIDGYISCVECEIFLTKACIMEKIQHVSTKHTTHGTIPKSSNHPSTADAYSFDNLRDRIINGDLRYMFEYGLKFEGKHFSEPQLNTLSDLTMGVIHERNNPFIKEYSIEFPESFERTKLREKLLAEMKLSLRSVTSKACMNCKSEKTCRIWLCKCNESCIFVNWIHLFDLSADKTFGLNDDEARKTGKCTCDG